MKPFKFWYFVNYDVVISTHNKEDITSGDEVMGTYEENPFRAMKIFKEEIREKTVPSTAYPAFVRFKQFNRL